MIGIIKGDSRYTYLAKMLDNVIISDKLEDFVDIDILLLPLGGINNDDIIKQTNINLIDILNNNRIKVIITGNNNIEIKNICEEYNIRLFNLLEDNDFVKSNALLTAKGALYFIHNGIFDIMDKRVLIIGYGNIGYYLAKLLKSYDMEFYIYTLNDIENKYINLQEFNKAIEITNNYDIIINTIPKNLDLDYSRLNGATIYDLASYPYGFDLEKIEANKIDYRILSVVPSKYAPESAAKIIKKIIENKILTCM